MKTKIPNPAGNRTLEPRSSSPQPSAIPTELSRLILVKLPIHNLFVFKFHGFGPLTCSESELLKLWILRHFVSILRTGIGSSQEFYLHRRARHRETQIYNHASSGTWTRNPIFRVVQDHMHFRQHGLWNRHHQNIKTNKFRVPIATKSLTSDIASYPVHEVVN
jgi:hypothetical protein